MTGYIIWLLLSLAAIATTGITAYRRGRTDERKHWRELQARARTAAARRPRGPACTVCATRPFGQCTCPADCGRPHCQGRWHTTLAALTAEDRAFLRELGDAR